MELRLSLRFRLGFRLGLGLGPGVLTSKNAGQGAANFWYQRRFAPVCMLQKSPQFAVHVGLKKDPKPNFWLVSPGTGANLAVFATGVRGAPAGVNGALDLRVQSDPRDCWCCRLFRQPTFSPKRTFGDIPLTAMLAGGKHAATQEQYRWDRQGGGPGGGPTTFNGWQLAPPGACGGGRQKLLPGARSAFLIGVQLSR